MTDNTLKPYVIGLDLGGTNSVFGIVDARGEIKATTAIKTGGYEKVEDYVKAAVEALQPIIDTVGGIDKIKAMGIGAPNANYYNGTIEFAPNLPWAHDGVVPLANLFSKALGGLPVGMTNDANAAALGEMTYGVARGMKTSSTLRSVQALALVSSSTDRWFTAATDSQANWVTLPWYVAKRVVSADAAVQDVSKLTALPLVWLAQLASISRRAMSLHCSAR